MKAQHIIAVTLIGWYLLIPPPKDHHAPLRKWKPNGTYDSAQECKDYKDKVLARADAAMHKIERRETGRGHAFWAAHVIDDYKDAQCVATDDPRLSKHTK